VALVVYNVMLFKVTITVTIRQMLERKWECNEEVHQLFIDFKKDCDSVRRDVLYKILLEFGIPRKRKVIEDASD